jgi:hypothetical protein
VVRSAAVALGLALLAACTNNPYPDADEDLKILYQPLGEPPRTLDPAVSYNAGEHQITGIVYATLLDYHYLARPYRLIPALAREVPHARGLPDGRVVYRFRLQEGALYQDDPAFALGEPSALTRDVVAGDVAFQLMRIADPAIASPVVATFAKIDGLREFSERLTALREADAAFANRRISEQYAAAGGISGVKVAGRYELELVLSEPYPQLLYWFTMPFTAPVPWEAVEYWDGEAGRAFFKDHPVGAGPFFVTRFDRQSRVVLDRNPNFYGLRHPEWASPSAIYPSEGEAEDAPLGRLDPAYVGRPLPFLDRVEFRLEKEDIPTFNKFLQGYYDASGILQDSFDKMVHEGALSGRCAQRHAAREVRGSGRLLHRLQHGRPGGGKRGRRKGPQAPAGDEPGGRLARVRARLQQRARRSGAVAAAARHFWLRGRLRESLPEGGSGAGEAAARGGRLSGRHDPKMGRPLHLSFDLGDTPAWTRALPVSERMEPPRADVEIAATNWQFRRRCVRTPTRSS